jgi:predicted nucleic acid-binding protein
LSLYLDTSALVPLFVQEASTESLTRYLAESEDKLVISDFAAGEFAAAISKAVRLHRLTQHDALAVIHDFDQWRGDQQLVLTTSPEVLLAAEQIVRRFTLKLMLPDAIHLAFCERGKLRLVSLDARQIAAGAALGLRVELPT